MQRAATVVRSSASAPSAVWSVALFAALSAAHASTAAGHAGPTSLRACRVLTDAAARLACYDALPDGDAATAATPVPVAPATSPPNAASTDRTGLPARPSDPRPPPIVSSVGPDFTGWEGGTRIRLANGQVWEVVDGSRGAIGPANRRVTVRPGSLGSFLLEFEGLNTSPRVRRLQ